MESFLRECCGTQDLSSVTNLNLRDRGLEQIDGTFFEQLSHIEVLDLSCNHLRELPRCVYLPLLSTLDCSNNQLCSLQFVTGMPSLRTLHAEGNPLDTSEHYMAVALCPSLQQINSSKAESLRQTVNKTKDIIKHQVLAVWEEKFADNYCGGIPFNELNSVTHRLHAEVVASKSPANKSHLSRFYNFMSQLMCDTLIEEVQMNKYEKAAGTQPKVQSPTQCMSPRLRSTTPCKSPKLWSTTPRKSPKLQSPRPCKSPKLQSTTPHKSPKVQSTTPYKSPRVQSTTPYKSPRVQSTTLYKSPRVQSTTLRKSPKVRSTTPHKSSKVQSTTLHKSPKVRSTTPHKSSKVQSTTPHKSSKVQSTTMGKSQLNFDKSQMTYMSLPSVADFDPVHFVRCHFGDVEAKKQKFQDNDPADDITKVWHCLFEPHPTNPGNTTSTVATCGGDTVCLIDCATGRVMKRYKQFKEQFFVLAWTTVPMKNENGVERPTNILAVAGFNGHIRLLHPDQFVCYAELGNGRPNRCVHIFFISALLFHPDEPTWLFSGASDSTITLMDIGIPSGLNYETSCRTLCIFGSPGCGILTMMLTSDCHSILAGTEDGCFAWHLKPSNFTKKVKNADVELILPFDDEKNVDSLVSVGEHLVVSRVIGKSCLCVWRLPVRLSNHRLTVQPLLLLDWSSTQVEYIMPAASDGIVMCGDDNGDLWMYNLQTLNEKRTFHNTIAQPSRVLTWPKCVIDKERKEEKCMTDVLNRVEELVVNCACLSSNREYLVSVTDNNLVCIWRNAQS